MNKTELIAAVAEKTGNTKKDTEKIVCAVLDTIMETVANEEKIHIVGFGSFECRYRQERTGCDPRTGESIVIPATKSPAFKSGRVFKDIVNNK